MLNHSHIQDAWYWEREKTTVPSQWQPLCNIENILIEVGFFPLPFRSSSLASKPSETLRLMYSINGMLANNCFPSILFFRTMALTIPQIDLEMMFNSICIHQVVGWIARKATHWRKKTTLSIHTWECRVEKHLNETRSSKKVMKIYGYRVCSTDLRFY